MFFSKRLCAKADRMFVWFFCVALLLRHWCWVLFFRFFFFLSFKNLPFPSFAVTFFFREYRSLCVLEVIHSCRSVSEAAVRSDDCFSVVLPSISITHTYTHSFFPFYKFLSVSLPNFAHLQRKRMTPGTWMWPCLMRSIHPHSWVQCQRGCPATRCIWHFIFFFPYLKKKTEINRFI